MSFQSISSHYTIAFYDVFLNVVNLSVIIASVEAPFGADLGSILLSYRF
jgi:hypothetical protein